jgi:sodium/potassium-transporting ATPase subunit beta
MAASAGGGVLGVTAIKPKERHGWDAISFFFYDADEGTVIGRTPKSWGLITLFYIVYYICLAGFWSLMMFVFFLTIDEEKPKWTGAASLIGTSPGLGIRPTQPDQTIDSSIIMFNYERKNMERGEEDNVYGTDVWTEQINSFMRFYDNKGKICSAGFHSDNFLNYKNEACQFKLEQLGECANEDNGYGYEKGMPCVYIKLNRLYGVPNEHYNGTIPFPTEMPNELVMHIKKQTDKDQVWLDCKGENPADVEAIGPMRYFPQSRGFPAFYFPYYNQEFYESPIIAVQFLKPKMGQLIHIECRAWAANINYNNMDRIGIVHFELFMLNDDLSDAYAGFL